MSDQDQGQQQVQIQVQPVPTVANIGSAQSPADGRPLVVIQLQTPVGLSAYFFDRDAALQLASEIRKAAQTGPQLVPAPPGLIVQRS